MKAFLITLFCSTVSFAAAQEKGVQLGLRLGEPVGFSFKKYVREDRALEIILGTAAKNWSGRYYRDAFKSYYTEDLVYQNHRINSVFYLQARYLFQQKIDVDQIPGRFEWYYGFGALFKYAHVDYFFRDRIPPPETFVERKNDIDFGPEVIAGFEYAMNEVPISFYIELSFIVELTNTPGIFRGFSAIGTRYRF